MKTSEFCFKACATCVVLVISILILNWLRMGYFLHFAKLIGFIGGVALVIGIIASIWEK